MMEHSSMPIAIDELMVQTLGRFRVWCAGEPIPESAWSRDKARKLFQYFITNPRQLTSKERIFATLWPELDLGRADRDFKVALNALQAALEPERPARAQSRYILRQGTSYGLNPDAAIEIDALQFEAGVIAGGAAEGQSRSEAIERYQAALHHYQGEYLPDTIYDDWTSALRERLAVIYLTAAGRLARLLLEKGAVVESIMWSEKVLAADPCWEEAYRLLMRAHLHNGNRPLAVRAYRQCRLVLAEELGIEPMAETVRLYDRLMGGEC